MDDRLYGEGTTTVLVNEQPWTHSTFTREVLGGASAVLDGLVRQLAAP